MLVQPSSLAQQVRVIPTETKCNADFITSLTKILLEAKNLGIHFGPK
jgi:hypothetical protein